MRKDHLHRRSAEASTNDASELGNGDPLSGSADPFDALLNSKPDESRSNGKALSPVPDDSDTENDNENDAPRNENEKNETNGDAVDGAKAENGGEDGYEVEDIVDHKFKGKKKYFKIRWKNFGEDDDTWELEKNLSCPEIIERYVAEHPDAATVVKEKKEKKVRISLPTKEPTRHPPKRTAAERKAIIDDPLESDGTTSVVKKKSNRGRPKKGANKPTKKEEYEVQKIIDDELRNGKKYYRIRWKGWGAKDDTWEPKSSLSCPEIIKAYENNKTDNEEYEVEKIVGEKIENGARYFLVKWKGWPESDNSWETEKSVDCYELIEKFRDSCRSTNKSTKRAASTTQKASKAKKSRKILSDNEDEDEGNDEEGDDDKGDDDGDGDGDSDSDGDGEEKEWEVEKIINFRKRAGKREFLIRWKGCKASDDTWEPENGINCPHLITAFLKKNKK